MIELEKSDYDVSLSVLIQLNKCSNDFHNFLYTFLYINKSTQSFCDTDRIIVMRS